MFEYCLPCQSGMGKLILGVLPTFWSKSQQFIRVSDEETGDVSASENRECHFCLSSGVTVQCAV